MERNLRFYDQLLKFPVFQGLSHAELLQLAGQTKFGFLKLPAGRQVVSEGDLCRQLYFLVGGNLQLTTESDDHSYAVSEQFAAPWLLQPEVLFGTSPRFTCSVRTLTEAHFITLSKDEVLRLIDDFLVFRLNFLNALSASSQRTAHRLWRRAPQNLHERIVRFLLDHSVYPAGRKEVHILMTRLAEELNDSRLNVSRELNRMQAEALVRLRRGVVEVPSLERLLSGS